VDTLQAIAARRSIRKFQEKPLPDEVVEQILEAATLAPSGKNSQPWRFYVVREDKRDEMVRVMREGIARAHEAGVPLGSAEWTARIMERAPVTVFVFNAATLAVEHGLDDADASLINLVDVQSVGAATQNMLLAALELGVGSLWICDVFYAYDELTAWLGETHQMIAAVSLGYPAESPRPRPRKPLSEITTWI
jgi:nitroreductase